MSHDGILFVACACCVVNYVNVIMLRRRCRAHDRRLDYWRNHLLQVEEDVWYLSHPGVHKVNKIHASKN